jgi:hypothetical protein
MALIQCQECKQEISDQAVVCPHCGAPQHHAEAASPPPPPERAPSGRRAGGPTRILLAVLVIGGIVAFQVLRRGTANANASASPAPRWLVDNVDANDCCTVLGEFCIRVRCAVTNGGTAQGVVQVAAELNEDSVTIGTRRGTRTLVPGQQDTLIFDFPEANLGKDHTFRCSPIP